MKNLTSHDHSIKKKPTEVKMEVVRWFLRLLGVPGNGSRQAFRHDQLRHLLERGAGGEREFQ